ncbi:MAG: hypothetical protein R3A10_18660 [Caldilineaceae bacterium]
MRPLRINADFACPATINPTVHHSSDHDLVWCASARTARRGWTATSTTPASASSCWTAPTLMATAVTDANGEFRVWNLTPGPVLVPNLRRGDGVELAADDFVLELDAGRNVLPPQEIVHATIRAGVDAAVQTLTCPPPACVTNERATCATRFRWFELKLRGS